MKAYGAGANAPRALLCALVLLFCIGTTQGTTPSFPWSIQGTPPSSVSAGQWFGFRPTAQLAGRPGRYFVIENKPDWATFDRASGLLVGRPMNAHAGTYAGVRISVTDGVLKMSLPVFSITVHASANGAPTEVSWIPPTENEDGSALTDLIGYHIYRGPTPDSLQLIALVMNPGVTDWHLPTPLPGRYYVAITAVNRRGMESEFSNLITEVYE